MRNFTLLALAGVFFSGLASAAVPSCWAPGTSADGIYEIHGDLSKMEREDVLELLHVGSEGTYFQVIGHPVVIGDQSLLWSAKGREAHSPARPASVWHRDALR